MLASYTLKCGLLSLHGASTLIHDIFVYWKHALRRKRVSSLFWQRVTDVIVGCFTGCMCKSLKVTPNT